MLKTLQVTAALPGIAVMLVLGMMPQAWADGEFLVNHQNNIMTIFKLQTQGLPFLAGDSRFLISPNPYSYTALGNSSNYALEYPGSTLVIADNDSLDADPTLGVIELVGVNINTYSITELKGPEGFLVNQEPVVIEIVNATISQVEMYSIPLSASAGSSTSVEPPKLDSTVLTLWGNKGAKVNGVTLDQNNLPRAIVAMTDSAQVRPDPVIFESAVDGKKGADALYDELDIPTYSAPEELSFANTNNVYLPPTFIASSEDTGKVVLTPKLDRTFRGLNMTLNMADQNLGLSKSVVDTLNIPIGVEGQDVGFKVKVQDTIPADLPASPMGTVPLFLSVDTTGTVDFGSSASFASPPKIKFKVDKSLDGVPSLNDGCPDVHLYLRNTSTNAWEIQTAPTRNSAADTETMCAYIQTLPHFSDYVVAGNNGSTPGSGSGGHGHGSGSGGVSTRGGSSGGHSGHSSSGSSSGGHSGHTSSDGSGVTDVGHATHAGTFGSVQTGTVDLKNSQGSSVSAIKAGSQLQISSQIRNTMNTPLTYAFIVQVLDENGFTTSVSWVDGELEPYQVLNPSNSWSPAIAGSYRVEVLVWNGVGHSGHSDHDMHMEPLSEKVTVPVEVVQ